jgi:hypothetical protein
MMTLDAMALSKRTRIDTRVTAWPLLLTPHFYVSS